MKLSDMLRQHLEWLDDEDGTMPFPEFEGETGWVSHDDGSIEDWGQYLLRLSLDEVAQLEAENAALKRLLTSMTCGECDETMPECTCPDTKSLLTREQE